MEPVSIRTDKVLVPPVPAPTQLPAATASSTSEITQPAAALRPGKRTSAVVSDYQLVDPRTDARRALTISKTGLPLGGGPGFA